MGKDFEACVRRAYEAILKPGNVAIDAGAHVGGHAFPMAERVAPRGKVYAFEPLAECRAAIERGIRSAPEHLRGVVELDARALGAEEGSAEFVVAMDLLAYSGLQERTYDAPTRLKRVPVRVTTIDALFLNSPALHYIKIDAEGGEYHILKGAEASIRKHRPAITFEFGAATVAHYGVRLADPAAFLIGLDYEIYDVEARRLATPEEFALSAERQQVWDYAALPSERRDWIDAVLAALRAA